MNPDELTWLGLPLEPTGAWARIEDDLRHGFHPKQEDLREIWRQAYPHRALTQPTRCRVCDGLGEVTWHKYVEGRPREAIGTVDCPQCLGTGEGPSPAGIDQP